MQRSLQAIVRGSGKQQATLIECLTDEKTHTRESLRALSRLLIDEIVENLSRNRSIQEWVLLAAGRVDAEERSARFMNA
jgi:hypothetical protein